MKPNTSQLVHHVEEGMGESMRMSMDADSVVHLMQLLTDLYSNPILAFIREYSTNARDSHIDAGYDGPVLVTLPTTMEPTFKVQDFGVGLDVDDLRDVYSMYGKSTKRNSDDTNGTLGLGCKSGLTYSLSFNVTAIKHGLKTVATVTKDTDGVGTIKIVDTVTTDEHNGVTVSIPVRGADVDKVRDEAVTFYKYWRNGTVLVDGEEPEFGDDALWLDPDIAVLPGPAYQNGGSKIVMGDVPYDFANKRSDYSIIAWVPMGTVNFTPSREALYFNERTEGTIKTIADFVEDKLPKEILRQVELCATPYEELIFSGTWGTIGRGVLRTKASRTGYLAMPSDMSAWHVQKSGYNGEIRASRQDSLSLSQLVGDYPVVTHFPNKSVSAAHKLRLVEYGLVGTKKVLLIPDGSDLHYLQGRDEVHSWDDIMAATVKPKVPRGTGGSRTKTLYNVRHNGTSSAVDRVTGTAPIVWASSSQYYYYANQFPEAQMVGLRANQEEKFKRLHPTAMSVHEYRRKLEKECRDNLTSDDKMLGGLDAGWLSRIRNVVGIEDPELKKVLDLWSHADTRSSKWLKRLREIGDTPSPHPIHQRLKDRYPLVAELYGTSRKSEDVAIYLNAKYNQSRRKNEHQVQHRHR